MFQKGIWPKNFLLLPLDAVQKMVFHFLVVLDIKHIILVNAQLNLDFFLAFIRYMTRIFIP